jgi:hypothetical protein
VGTSFEALVDSGTSFTSLPLDVYKAVTVEVNMHLFAAGSFMDNFQY